MTAEHELIDNVLEKLILKFGHTDFVSDVLPFNFTAYYEKEIGGNLFRHIISFYDLIPPESLPSIKLWTNKLETDFSRNDATRRINLDPGYIALSHLVLATCKSFSHRPYLRDGVYADLTLIFKGRTFCPIDWTFPDYGSDTLINLLNKIRAVYHDQLKKHKEGSLN